VTAIGGEAPLPPALAQGEQSRFVGRGPELRRLDQFLAEAVDGSQSVVLLSGEPGIGKTRLVREFCRHAHAEGASVLYGRSDEETVVPYQPFVETLRHYIASCPPDALRAQLGDSTDLVRLVPELADRLPVDEAAASGGEGERQRLFESVSRLLANASIVTPLVVVLDDLHWADEATLHLLGHVVRWPQRAAALVLATYRETELAPDHPLSELIAALSREELMHRLPLVGLSERDTTDLVDALSEVSRAPGLARAIHDQTAGNPLFVAELVRHLDELGPASSLDEAGIPERIKQVIDYRVGGLDEATRRVLTIASVVGREFGIDALEWVSGLSRGALASAVDEAVSARVIAPAARAPGRYEFTHPLIRETLYGALSAKDRVNLHRAVAEVFEALFTEGLGSSLSELAHHYLAGVPAADPARAVDYAERAAREATRILAYEEAAGLLERALEALDAAGTAGGRDEERRCELLLAIGAADWDAGRFDRARAAFASAAECAEELGAPGRLARAAVGAAGPFTSPGIVDEELIALLERALAGLDEQDSTLRARVTGRLADQLTFAGSRERAAELAAEGVAMARRTGDAGALSDVLRDAHWATWHPDNLEDRLASASEIVTLALDAGETAIAAQALGWRVSALLELGDRDAADEDYGTVSRLAEERRQPYLVWQAAVQRAMRALLDGPYEEVEELANAAVASAQDARNAVQGYGVQLMALRREQGRWEELAPSVEAFAAGSPAIPAWRCAKAWVHAETGHMAEARAELDALAPDDFAALPRDMFWFGGMLGLSETACALGDSSRAATLRELLLPYHARQLVPAAIPAVCFGPVQRLLGRLAATAGALEEAAQHFELALAGAVHIRSEPVLARVKYDYARALVLRGAASDGERARTLLGEVRTSAERLGMPKLAADAALGEADLVPVSDA
jgi:hypothetical protein